MESKHSEGHPARMALLGLFYILLGSQFAPMPLGVRLPVIIAAIAFYAWYKNTDPQVVAVKHKTNLVPASDPGRGTLQGVIERTSAESKKIRGSEPFCAFCGHVTVQSDNRYKCLDCGTTVGCS